MTFRAWLFATLLLATFIAYHDSLRRLIGIWQQQESYSHSWLLAPLVLYLTYRSISQNTHRSGAESGIGLLIVAGSVLVWLLASAMTIQAIELAAILSIVWGLIGVNYGWPIMLATLWPLSIAIWTIPVWDYATGFAQTATVWASSQLIGMADITAFIDGNFVYVRAGRFEIARGCSGIHYLIVAGALGSVYACLNLARRNLRLLCIFSAILAAIVLNWFRVFTIVLAGYASDMQHFLVTIDHYWYGWLLFLLMLFPLYYFFRYLERWDGKSALDNEKVTVRRSTGNATRPGIVWFAALILVVATPLGLIHARERIAGHASQDIALPNALGEWSLEIQTPERWQPRFFGPSAERLVSYRKADLLAGTYVNAYGSQRQGAELINDLNRLVPDAVGPSTASTLDISRAKNVPVKVNEIVYFSAGARQLVLYVYVVDGTPATGSIEVKLLQLQAFLRGRSAGGVVAVHGECTTNCEKEREYLAELIALLLNDRTDG